MKISLLVKKLGTENGTAYDGGTAFVSIYDDFDGVRELIRTEKFSGKTAHEFRRVVSDIPAPRGVFAIEVDPVRNAIAEIEIEHVLQDDEPLPERAAPSVDPVAIIAQDSDN